MEFWAINNKNERKSFAEKNVHRDWTKVLFSGITEIRCVSVFAMIDEHGPRQYRIIDGRFDAVKYIDILENVVLPYIVRNGSLFAQVKTKSELIQCKNTLSVIYVRKKMK